MFIGGIKMKTGYKVFDAMTKEPVYVSPETSVVDAAKKMKEYGVGALLVIDNEAVQGICTEQDLIYRVLVEEKDAKKTSVKSIMTKEVRSISPDDDIFDALMKMRELDVRHLPVELDMKFIGLLTMKDILKIEPQLFDLIVDKYELREEENKPIKLFSDGSEEVDHLINDDE
jgi:signal-transduction protein with cAMP-binding, CBS, and nucleotidyltransferase domain